MRLSGLLSLVLCLGFLFVSASLCAIERGGVLFLEIGARNSLMVAHEVIVVGDAAVHVCQQASLVGEGLRSAEVALVCIPEVVLDAASMPLDEIDNPSQQDRSSLINREEVDWRQVLVVGVQYAKHPLHEHGFDLRWVHQHQLKLESHGAHQLPGHRPIRSNTASQYANHLQHLLDQVIWLDLLPHIDHVLLCELPYGDLRHLDSVVELFFGELYFKLIVLQVTHVLISVGKSWRLCIWMASGYCAFTQAKLIDEIWIVQEIVQAEDSTLPLLLEYLLIGDDVSWVDLGDDVDAIVDVSHSVSSSTDLTAFSFCIQSQAL